MHIMQHEKTHETAAIFDPLKCTENMVQAMQEWCDIMHYTLAHQSGEEMTSHEHEVVQLSSVFSDAFINMTSNPETWMSHTLELAQDYTKMWQSSMQQFFNAAPQQSTPNTTPIYDRRFKDESWQQSAWFDLIRQSYHTSAKGMERMINHADMEPQQKQKTLFYLRQIIDALSPTNFVMTNPVVLREVIESNGENLLRGMRNMRQDLEKGSGRLSISMTDENAFTLGENIATTKGEVVFQNKLMQLIQYHSTTEQVHTTPLLIVPAWINKYYVLDMRPENSLVKWLTDQGHTVFIISWANPDASFKNTQFENYMSDGVIAALDAITDITGETSASAIGYCLGGTLLASTAAYLQSHGKSERIASATYLTTMIDFEDAGELGLFIDEEQISTLEAAMEKTGYLDGSHMADTFNMLRANDLIWSFFVNNYLLGKSPFPFDLLYWNSDATRLPAAMHSFYLRNMYLENTFKDAGGITLCDTPIDLSTITTPSYILSCKEDHIAPWQSTYQSTGIYSGDVTFVLSASGHIAGVVNPPAKGKYGHWVNDALAQNADSWFEGSEERDGSWWTHWNAWQKQHAGDLTPARTIAKSIEPAPGSYVKSR